MHVLNGGPIVVNGYILVPGPTYGYLYVATATVLDKNKKTIQNQALTAYETLPTISASPPNVTTPAPNRRVAPCPGRMKTATCANEFSSTSLRTSGVGPLGRLVSNRAVPPATGRIAFADSNTFTSFHSSERDSFRLEL
jgi:hypothetical protein